MRVRGFTLIEVALLLVVIGLVTSSFFAIAGPLIDAQRTSVTNKRITLIEHALQSYVEQFGFLPCPADGTLASTGADNDFGRSFAGAAVVATNCTAAVCQIADAVVPWRTLGLAEEQTTDGWGNRIRYYLAGTACAPTAVNIQNANGMVRCGVSSYPAGTVTIEDNDGVFGNMTNAAFVVISNGPDKSLALKFRTAGATADRYAQGGGGLGQDENTNGDATFSEGDFIGTGDANHFDDILRFSTAAVMIQKCGLGTCGNPS